MLFLSFTGKDGRQNLNNPRFFIFLFNVSTVLLVGIEEAANRQRNYFQRTLDRSENQFGWSSKARGKSALALGNRADVPQWSLSLLRTS